MADHPSLFAPGVLDAAPIVGDELGRMLSPRALASACLERVLLRAAIGSGHRMLEPSVGGGAFVAAMRAVKPKVRIDGVDLDPLARGLALCDNAIVADAVKWAAGVEPGRYALIIGNPPFGRALEHVRALLALRPYRLALVLPWDRAGRQGWREVLYGEVEPGIRLREIHPIIPRPWGQHVREVALYVWGPLAPGGFATLQPVLWREGQHGTP